MIRVRASLSLAALFLTPFWTTPASAQVGFHGGINLTDLVGGGVGQSEGRTGLNVGLGYEILRLGALSLGPEIHYAQRGAEAFQALFPTPGDGAPGAPVLGPVDVALEYVEIPLVARLRLPLGDRFHSWVMGGPVFGWKLDCEVRGDPGAGTVDPDCDDLLSREGLQAKVRNYEQGYFLGAALGIDVLGGMGALTLDGRFIQGLTRLGEGDGGPDVKNRGFSLMLGYVLGL